MPIDCERRERFVAGEYLIDRVTRRLQRGIVQRAFGKYWCETGGVQQDIPVAQRNIQLLGQVQHHVTARP